MADQKQMQQQAKLLFDKGFAAFERGNIEIAISLLLKSVQMEPDFFRARMFLRKAQIRKFKNEKKSNLALQFVGLLAFPTVLKVKMLLGSRKYSEAMAVCEELFSLNPFSQQFLALFADAAEGAGDQDALLITMEELTAASPNDVELMLKAGQVYMKNGVFDRARNCFAAANEARPQDLNIFKMLKDADAKNTMTEGGWEKNAGKQGGYRDLIRDKDQAKRLDLKNKAVSSGDDADSMVNDFRTKIAREPKNLNFYRGLARILQQSKRFDEALEVMKQAQVINPADPELDRSIVQIKVASFESQIEIARTAGDEAKIEALVTERNQFVFDNLLARVERYPNDLGLRFELGQQYFIYKAWDDALAQFQLAQKSPKVRIEALYFLAVCFKEKGQKDMAIMQLETANEQLPLMDDLKKKIVYTLGLIAEEDGDVEKAFSYYKDVYAADIGFMDIGVRMERLYKLRQTK